MSNRNEKSEQYRRKIKKLGVNLNRLTERAGIEYHEFYQQYCGRARISEKNMEKLDKAFSEIAGIASR